MTKAIQSQFSTEYKQGLLLVLMAGVLWSTVVGGNHAASTAQTRLRRRYTIRHDAMLLDGAAGIVFVDLLLRRQKEQSTEAFFLNGQEIFESFPVLFVLSTALFDKFLQHIRIIRIGVKTSLHLLVWKQVILVLYLRYSFNEIVDVLVSNSGFRVQVRPYYVFCRLTLPILQTRGVSSIA